MDDVSLTELFVYCPQELVVANHRLREHLKAQAVEVASLRQEILGKHLTGKKESEDLKAGSPPTPTLASPLKSMQIVEYCFLPFA